MHNDNCVHGVGTAFAAVKGRTAQRSLRFRLRMKVHAMGSIGKENCEGMIRLRETVLPSLNSKWKNGVPDSVSSLP